MDCWKRAHLWFCFLHTARNTCENAGRLSLTDSPRWSVAASMHRTPFSTSFCFWHPTAKTHMSQVGARLNLWNKLTHFLPFPKFYGSQKVHNFGSVFNPRCLWCTLVLIKLIKQLTKKLKIPPLVLRLNFVMNQTFRPPLPQFFSRGGQKVWTLT